MSAPVVNGVAVIFEKIPHRAKFAKLAVAPDYSVQPVPGLTSGSSATRMVQEIALGQHEGIVSP